MVVWLLFRVLLALGVEVGAAKKEEASFCSRSVQSVDNPSFKVCGPPAYTTFIGGDFPADAGDEHGGDPHPFLMEAARPVGGPADAELFLDLGSSVGPCSLLMLSKGFRVFAVEQDEERMNWANASVHENAGFAERATLRRVRVGMPDNKGQKESLDSLLPAPTVVRLWKIDVDGAELEVLRSFDGALRGGRVDVIEIELIEEEVIKESGISKLKVLQYIEDLGYSLYAQVRPDRIENDLDGDASDECKSFMSWVFAWDLVTVSAPWVDMPDVGGPVLPLSQSDRYAYGQDRCLHFSYTPFCAGSGAKESMCFIHYVAVRHGSIAAQSPPFANHRCTQDFYDDVRQRLRDALADGNAQTGPPLDLLFVQPGVATRDDL